MTDQEYDNLLRSMSIDSPNYDFGDINLGAQDFGSNFDLGSFEDLDLSSLEGMDFGSNFDLGSFEDIAAADLSNIDFGSLADLGSFEDIAAADLAGTDFGSLAELGSFEDLAAVELGNRGYYDEESGKFISDPNGPLAAPLDNTSGTNKESMDGYTYDKKSGTWTTPRGETYTPKVTPTHTTKSGGQVMVNAGALPSGYAGLTPDKGSTADLKGGKDGKDGKSGNDGKGGGTKTNTQQGGLGTLLPLLLALLAMNKGGGGGGGSKGAVIPGLTATQRQTPYAQQQRAPGYRPGQGGISYFDQTQYTPKMAAGGGIARLLDGPGDGVSDSIPAVIDEGMAGGGQPAKVARGEYIFDARSVAALGNGSTDAGAERLDKMREDILRDDRKAKIGEDSKAYRHLLA
jgi:hypothetical protein